MKDNRPNEFYDEVLRALWGFVGDKLNMPVERLSHENISQQLEARNVGNDVISQFIGALDECEYARYAPGDATGNMNKVYDTAISAITQIASTMKKSKRPVASSRLILLLVISLISFFSSLSTHAATKAEADSAYAQGHYQQAAKLYEELLKKGVSVDLYYNLGNAYYRMDEMPRAVLNYERALMLSPGDRDVRFNLQMARSKTIDKITPESEMFFVTWYHSLVNFSSVDGWARLALITLALAIVLALVYLFASPIWLRKMGFFGAFALLLVFIVANIFAYAQKQSFVERSGAIIMAPAATVKSTPAKQGTDLFILHEGTRVDITDGTMREWKRIRVADGKEGWIETSQIEVI
jgi:tetratricopeptide (TPR) repeat protein